MSYYEQHSECPKCKHWTWRFGKVDVTCPHCKARVYGNGWGCDDPDCKAWEFASETATKHYSGPEHTAWIRKQEQRGEELVARAKEEAASLRKQAQDEAVEARRRAIDKTTIEWDEKVRAKRTEWEKVLEQIEDAKRSYQLELDGIALRAYPKTS